MSAADHTGVPPASTTTTPSPAVDVSSAEAPLVPLPGLYVHIPFCAKKCPYCDFNTYAGLERLYDDYVNALTDEIARRAPELAGRSVGSVFIGGGTPTVLSAGQLERIVNAVRKQLAVADDAEWTCEANPGTVDRAKFAALRSLGVDRLSLGAQSFAAQELDFLGRIHGADDIAAAFQAARAAGFERINLDLIFGLPDQPPARWARTLERALALEPEHLSLYSLIVEPGTPLHQWVRDGRVPAPDDDAAAELYALTKERLASSDYVHYEVSNWARSDAADAPDASPVLASRHNLVYWRNGEYLGVGPGAHSHLRRVAPSRPDGAARPDDETGTAQPPTVSQRWGNVRPVPAYLERVRDGRALVDDRETLDAATAMGETMMLGLRLVREGVPHARFRALHGADPRTTYAPTLAQLTEWGLLTVDAHRVRLTERGLMVANQVVGHFLPTAADD